MLFNYKLDYKKLKANEQEQANLEKSGALS